MVSLWTLSNQGGFEELRLVATCYTENAAGKDEQESGGLFAQSLSAMQRKSLGIAKCLPSNDDCSDLSTEHIYCLPLYQLLFSLNTLVHCCSALLKALTKKPNKAVQEQALIHNAYIY